MGQQPPDVGTSDEVEAAARAEPAREFPIFVPHEHERLAAVVTLPAARPRGLVLLLPGASLDEVLGSFQLYPWAAAELASRGLASARLDYEGVGDSTGPAPSWSLTVTDGAYRQAQALRDCVRNIVEVERYAIGATCFGARIALRMASDIDCAGAISLAPPLIDPGLWTRARRRLGASAAVSLLRSSRTARRLILRPLRRALSERRPTRLVETAISQLDRTRLAFLYSEVEVGRDRYRLQTTRSLNELGAKLGDAERARYSVQLLPTGALTGFDLLSRPSQELIVSAFVDWLEACFPSDAEPPAAERPHRAAEMVR